MISIIPIQYILPPYVPLIIDEEKSKSNS